MSEARFSICWVTLQNDGLMRKLLTPAMNFSQKFRPNTEKLQPGWDLEVIGPFLVSTMASISLRYTVEFSICLQNKFCVHSTKKKTGALRTHSSLRFINDCVSRSCFQRQIELEQMSVCQHFYDQKFFVEQTGPKISSHH